MFAFFLVSAFSSSKICKACQQTCRLLRKGLERGIPEESIAIYLEKQCSRLPEDYQAPCTKVLNGIESVIEDLQNGEQTLAICQKHNLCLDVPTRPVRQVSNYVYEPIVEKDGVKCAVCTRFVEWAEERLNDYSFKGIRKLIDEKCPDYKYIRDFCSEITDAQIHAILNALFKRLPAEKVCEWVKVC